MIRDILKEFRERLEMLYGDRFKKMILYGFCARGQASSDSHVDLVVVLRGKIRPGEEVDRMIGAITDVNLKYSVMLSVSEVSEEDYSWVQSPLLVNVRREGMAV